MATFDASCPAAVEAEFYAALEAADPERMMAVWEQGGAIVCIHPMGPRLEGVDAVRLGWERIFAGGTRLRFLVDRVSAIEADDLVVRIVRENIVVLGADEQPAQPVVATNLYRRGPHGWRMIVHHASPEPVARTPAKTPSVQLH